MTESFIIEVAAHGRTTARVYRAEAPSESTLILAHGAGAGQAHPFMIDMAQRIARRGIDVVTFDFLYIEQGRKMPDRTHVLEACWHAVIASVRARSGLPTGRLYCGGKSMGGRIASNVAVSPAGEGLTVDGLVFLGYPLHPVNKPKVRRDEHLPRVPFPMLFVQGSRDALGDAREIRALVRRLSRASVHIVEGGDHSLALPKRDGAAAQEAGLDRAAAAIATFAGARAQGGRCR